MIQVRIEQKSNRVTMTVVAVGPSNLTASTRDMMYFIYKYLTHGRLPDMHPSMLAPGLSVSFQLKSRLASKNEFSLSRRLLNLCERHNARLKTLEATYRQGSLSWETLKLQVEVTGPPSRVLINNHPIP